MKFIMLFFCWKDKEIAALAHNGMIQHGTQYYFMYTSHPVPLYPDIPQYHDQYALKIIL